MKKQTERLQTLRDQHKSLQIRYQTLLIENEKLNEKVDQYWSSIKQLEQANATQSTTIQYLHWDNEAANGKIIKLERQIGKLIDRL